MDSLLIEGEGGEGAWQERRGELIPQCTLWSMSITLNVILFVSLGWLCCKMLLFYLCTLMQIYSKNGPNVTVTSQIISQGFFQAVILMSIF